MTKPSFYYILATATAAIFEQIIRGKDDHDSVTHRAMDFAHACALDGRIVTIWRTSKVVDCPPTN